MTSSGGWGDVEELNAPTSKKIEHWEQQWIMTYAICSSPVLYAFVSASHHVTTAISLQVKCNDYEKFWKISL